MLDYRGGELEGIRSVSAHGEKGKEDRTTKKCVGPYSPT